MKKFFENYGGVIGMISLFALIVMPVVVNGVVVTSPSNSRSLVNPLGVTSFCALIVKLVQALTAIGIPIAILFIVWAGFKFVVAGGKPDKLTEARRNFLYVVIGIAIFVGATVIANILVATVTQLGVQGLNSCR